MTHHASPRASALRRDVLGLDLRVHKDAGGELGSVEIFALRLAIGLPFVGGVLLVRRVPVRLTHACGTLVLAGVYVAQRKRRA
jgi:hypothetical protein